MNLTLTDKNEDVIMIHNWFTSQHDP